MAIYSYLASERSYGIVKKLEEANLVIPLVGDFAGPKMIRALGSFLKENAANITVFYLSNVEHFVEDAWKDFCGNVSSLPLDETSTLIRWMGSSPGDSRNMLASLRDFSKGCISNKR